MNHDNFDQNKPQNIKLLYVEDNIEVAQAMNNLLGNFIQHIKHAKNGKEALELYKKKHFDLIITDIYMPEMNGIELINKIRKNNIHIPILVISAYSERKELFDAIHAGVDGFIVKPIESDQFILTLKMAIKKTLIQKENKKNIAVLNQYKEITNKSAIISKTDPNGIITFANENFCSISEFTKEELLGKSHNIVRHPDTPRTLFKELWETIKVQKKPWEGIIKNQSKSGKPYYVKTIIKPLLDQNGNVLEYMALRNDISSIMSEKKQLLTSLESMDSALLIIIQIENFDILDKFYDALTIEKIENIYGERLLSYMPEYILFNKIYKLGDGRFALTEDYNKVINKHKNIDINNILGKFIKNTKNSTIKLENIDYDISIMVSYCYGKTNLYENAKYGIEKAIEENRSLIFANNFVDEIHKTAQHNIETIQMVKKALDNYKIVSFFQPIIDNKTKEIIKYESLVRLINENDEIVSPFFFLDVSKKGAYYTRITQRVIENSFEILHHIKNDVSINLSVLDIENETIRNKLIKLVSNPIYKGRVTFELLEDENMKDFQTIKDFIKLVKETGNVKIAIDDFGSGYSNFERLLEYTPDILKIDGSLIKNIETDLFSKNLVETIVTFAKKQNIQTIAEFVENEKIYNILKEMGIDYSQGFYFGKPQRLI